MEEDYINMEMDSSFASIFNHSNKEFEFQSFSTSSGGDHDHHNHHHHHFTATTSPADELFYMGKLLPLHLPPRLEMVQKILMHTYTSNNNTTNTNFEQEELPFTTPLTSNTPYQSCNISPSDSCQVSRELNPKEYFLECSKTPMPTPPRKEKKKSWTKKIVKQSSSMGFGSKFKWGYFKSFFTKSGCSAVDHQHSGSTAPAPKSKKFEDYACSRTTKSVPAPFGQIKYDDHKVPCSSSARDSYTNGGNFSHRRSFSGAFRTLSKPKKSSCSSCSPSNSNVSVQVLRRSSSAVSSELESPIQAAIAHCKRSLDQQQYLIVFKKDCQ